MTSSFSRTDWNERYAGSELLSTAQPNRFLVSEVAQLRPGRALDVACGEGRNAVWLAERGWKVTGVDFSDVALAKARKLAESRNVEADWVEGDLLDYRPERRAFDLVIVFYLQLPAIDRRPILQAAADAVAAGGTFLLVAHDSSNLEHGYGGPRDVGVLYTAIDVVRDLDAGRLEIERADRVERPVETAGTTQTALDALVVARRPPSQTGEEQHDHD